MNKNRKILFFSLTRSGCIEYTQELLRSFKPEEIYLIVSEQSEKYFPNYNLSIGTYNSTTGFFFETLRFNKKIRKIIEKLLVSFEDSIIYCPSFHPWNYIIAKVAKKRKVPFVLTIHDYQTHSGNKRKGIEYIQRKTAQLSLITVFLSEDQRTQAIKQGLDKSKTHVLPHPLFRVNTINKLAYNSFPKLLFIGYLQKYKGLDLLLESIPKLNIEVLTIAGHGRFKHDKLSNSKVNFINKKLNNEDLYSLLDSHEILILPYRDATQSGVLSLGISKEVVMLISNHSGLKEQLSENSALWCEPNILDIEKSLKELINNENTYERTKKNLKLEKKELEKSWTLKIKQFKLKLQELAYFKSS